MDNDDEFNSHSEDNQDLAPDTEIQNVSVIQSDVSTDDMRFQYLVEEVIKLLPADMFPKKTEEFWEGIRQDLPLSWRCVRLPIEHFFASIKAPFD